MATLAYRDISRTSLKKISSISTDHRCHTLFTAILCFNCTNNMAEYETCIFGFKATIDLGIKSLVVFGDSALFISQIKGEWDTKHPNLIPYKEHVLTLLPHFEQITF